MLQLVKLLFTVYNEQTVNWNWTIHHIFKLAQLAKFVLDLALI